MALRPAPLPISAVPQLWAASSGSLEVGCEKGPNICPEPSLGFLWQDPASVQSRGGGAQPFPESASRTRNLQGVRGPLGEQQEGLKVDFRVNFQTSGEFSGHVCHGGLWSHLSFRLIEKRRVGLG